MKYTNPTYQHSYFCKLAPPSMVMYGRCWIFNEKKIKICTLIIYRLFLEFLGHWLWVWPRKGKSWGWVGSKSISNIVPTLKIGIYVHTESCLLSLYSLRTWAQSFCFKPILKHFIHVWSRLLILYVNDKNKYRAIKTTLETGEWWGGTLIDTLLTIWVNQSLSKLINPYKKCDVYQGLSIDTLWYTLSV